VRSRIGGSRLTHRLEAMFRAAADCSYSVFLTRYLCISAAHRLLERFHLSAQPLGDASELSRMGLLLVVSRAVGDLTYRYVERPSSAQWAAGWPRMAWPA
jgi:peptidoglycan/LPS O-acetylase OafA/YrhL